MVPSGFVVLLQTAAVSAAADDFFEAAVKLAVAALVGFIASNVTIGRKLTANSEKAKKNLSETEARLMNRINAMEAHANLRTTRLEHEMWGTQGSQGLVVVVERISEKTNRSHDMMVRIETKLNMALNIPQGDLQ